MAKTPPDLPPPDGRDIVPQVLDLAVLPQTLTSNLGLAFALLSGLMFGGQFLATFATSAPLWEAGPGIGFLEDISTSLNFLLLFPLVLVLLVRFFRRVEGFLRRSAADGVISLEASSIRERLAFLSSPRALFTLGLAASVLTAAIMFFHIGNTLEIEGYFAVEVGRLHAAGVVMMSLTAIFIFLLLLGFLRALLWLWVLRVIFAGNIRIDFMHADGAGGLREAGLICMTLNYVLFALAITLGLFVYTDAFVFQNVESVRVLIMAPAYFVLTPFTFFYALVPIYRAMKRERRRHLTIVSERFNRLFQELQAQTIETEAQRKQLSERVVVMRDLQEMYSWINRLPRWPIDLPMYFRFSLSLLVPLIGYVFQLLDTDSLGSLFPR